MQDHFQTPFESKFLIERWRQRPSRPSDPYAVEPWEKTILQIEIERPNEGKKYKTFYHTPLRRPVEKREDRKYQTQRVFSFRKQKQIDNNLEKLSWVREERENMRSLSHQNTISHYNINGNFLQELFPQEKRKIGNQFIVRSPNKHEMVKSKKKKSPQKPDEDATIPVSNIDSIKRRVDLCRHYSNREDEKFVQFHTDTAPPDQNYFCSPVKKRRKVLSLGFHKLSAGPRLIKQSSTCLQPSFML